MGKERIFQKRNGELVEIWPSGGSGDCILKAGFEVDADGNLVLVDGNMEATNFSINADGNLEVRSMASGKIILGRVRPVMLGEYDASRAYKVLERVSHNGRVYECHTDAAAGIEPGEADYWISITGRDGTDVDLSHLVPKTGNRGSLAGNETASEATGSQTINADSPDCMNISASGAVSLTFTPADKTVRAVKALSITATAAATLSVFRAVWQNGGTAPTWARLARYWCFWRTLSAGAWFSPLRTIRNLTIE